MDCVVCIKFGGIIILIGERGEGGLYGVLKLVFCRCVISLGG